MGTYTHTCQLINASCYALHTENIKQVCVSLHQCVVGASRGSLNDGLGLTYKFNFYKSVSKIVLLA